MMQKDVNVYKASLYTSADWDGEYDIEIRMTDYWVSEDWHETIKQSGGALSAKANSANPPKIYHYHLWDDNTVTVQLEGSSEPPVPVTYKVPFLRTKLDTDSEDINISHREYDVNGEPMVEISITNRAGAVRGAHRTTLRTYGDGEEELFSYELPDNVLSDAGSTIILPLAWLKNGHDTERLTVEVMRDKSKETGKIGNSFVLEMKTPQLRFKTLPKDATVMHGTQAEFTAEAEGGQKPYDYQWQRMMNDGSWQDIAGATEPTYLSDNATSDMNGMQLRCVVTDARYDTIVSAPATLSVMSIPMTGDNAKPVLWLALCTLSIGTVLCVLVRKRKAHVRQS